MAPQRHTCYVTCRTCNRGLITCLRDLSDYIKDISKMTGVESRHTPTCPVTLGSLFNHVRLKCKVPESSITFMNGSEIVGSFPIYAEIVSDCCQETVIRIISPDFRVVARSDVNYPAESIVIRCTCGDDRSTIMLDCGTLTKFDA